MTNEINVWVGGEIKAWRECNGWTICQLSKHSGVQESSIKNIEQGKGLSVKTLFKLLEAMDLDLTITRKPNY